VTGHRCTRAIWGKGVVEGTKTVKDGVWANAWLLLGEGKLWGYGAPRRGVLEKKKKAHLVKKKDGKREGGESFD